MLKRKRTQAFTATKDKRVKAIIKQNAETPLLRLPLELRKSIWHYLLGDRTIHIKFAPTHRWEEKIRCRGPARSAFKGHFTYIVCEANISEQAACDMFENGASDMKAAEKDTVMDTGLCRNRHADCYACYDDCLDKNYVMYDKNVGKPIDLERLRRNRMHLDILRVCRQAYIEANSVLWGSSLWSFTNSLAFSKFMEYRNAVQRREMNNMHLDLDMRYHWKLDTWAYGWYSVLKKSVLVKFSALKVVHLDITGNQWVRDSDFIGGPRMLRSDLEFNMLADLWHLTPKTLTVTCMETANMNGSKMTQAQRQQMANNIRKKLVDFTKAPYSKDYLTYSPEASKER